MIELLLNLMTCVGIAGIPVSAAIALNASPAARERRRGR